MNVKLFPESLYGFKIEFNKLKARKYGLLRAQNL